MTSKALILGFFSTVGDIECLEFVQGKVAGSGIAFDVAAYSDKIGRSLPGSVRVRDVRPSDYTHLIVVCGPIWPGLLGQHGLKLADFGHCLRIGVNLTLIEGLDAWNPFDLLLERDSDRETRPDLTFACETRATLVVGVCVIERQKEYGERQRHRETIGMFERLVARQGAARVDIDTRWPAWRNSGALANPDQVASVVRRMDVVLTNRLHGLVFALKSGVPAIAVDSVAGGGKVIAQSRRLGWRACSLAEAASDEWLDSMLAWCLGPEARGEASRCSALAATIGEEVGSALDRGLREPFAATPPPPEPARKGPLFRSLARRIARKL